MGGIRRRHLIVFFVLAFALSWTVWMTSVAQAHGWLSFHIPQSLAFWLGLTIATYLTAGLSGGKAAIRDLVGRMLRWRVSPRWYAVAVGLPFAMGVAQAQDSSTPSSDPTTAPAPTPSPSPTPTPTDTSTPAPSGGSGS